MKRNTTGYSLIVVGLFLQTLSCVLFLVLYKIILGGVYGISTIIHYVTRDLFPLFPDGLLMGATALYFNIPLMILAMEKIGLSSGPETTVTFLLTSIFVDSLSYFLTDPLVGNDAFITTFYDEAILDLGVTYIFRAQSASADTDVLARMIANDSNLKVNNMIIVLDPAVILSGLIIFKDWAIPLYPWLTIFVYGKIVEMFRTENLNRAVFTVPRRTQGLKTLIVDKTGMRGTFIHGKEMYQGNETEIIFTAAEREDMPRSKDEMEETDPNAFVSMMHASKNSPRPDI